MPQNTAYSPKFFVRKGKWLKQNLTLGAIDHSKGHYLLAPFNLQASGSECYVFETTDLQSFVLETLLVENKGEKSAIVSDQVAKLFGSLATEESKYKTLVKQAIQEIRQGKFTKLVCSIDLTFMIDDGSDYIMGFDLLTIFLLLSERYPFAMVSLIKHPELGIWITASPELFLAKHDSLYTTVSLAGTKFNLSKEDHSLLTEAWGPKEIGEQAHVTNYIKDSLQELGVTQVRLDGPKTIHAGPVSHLKTIISWPENEIAPEVIISELHPTSATLGSPKLAAFDFLSDHELYDRSLYCGFSGPISDNGDFDLFVNLRTMKIDGNAHTFFVGAGITADSDPDSEWLEVLNKAKTLLEPILALKNEVLT